MQVIMLSSPYCNKCAMAKRILGDRVEVQNADDRPDLLEHSAHAELPLYFVIKDGECIGHNHGLMPSSVFDEWVANYR